MRGLTPHAVAKDQQKPAKSKKADDPDQVTDPMVVQSEEEPSRLKQKRHHAALSFFVGFGRGTSAGHSRSEGQLLEKAASAALKVSTLQPPPAFSRKNNRECTPQRFATVMSERPRCVARIEARRVRCVYCMPS